MLHLLNVQVYKCTYIRIQSIEIFCTYIYMYTCIGSGTISPSASNLYGGTPVVVTLESSCIMEDYDISCVFGHTEVSGKYISDKQAYCISPTMENTGRVSFKFKLNKGSREIFSTTISKGFIFSQYNYYYIDYRFLIYCNRFCIQCHGNMIVGALYIYYIQCQLLNMEMDNVKIHTGIRSEANLIHLFSGLSERHGDAWNVCSYSPETRTSIPKYIIT